jgi:NAD-dependent SIR2 family protein deacetylase
MLVSCNDCPHLNKEILSKLMTIEKSNNSFDKLKCKQCNENKELWICLVCGDSFCSQKIKDHISGHNKESNEHYLFLNSQDISMCCFKCQDDKNKNSYTDKKESCVEPEISEQFNKIIIELKSRIKKEESNKSTDQTQSSVNEPNYSEVINEKNEICSHIKDGNIINDFNDYLNPYFENTVKIIHGYNDKNLFAGICLNCGDKFNNFSELIKHNENQKHKLYINFGDYTIVCYECKSKYPFSLVNDYSLKYKLLFQFLFERGVPLLNVVKLMTKQEVFNVKYEKFKSDFMNNKFKKILFMVGAGISTSAGIPDFRSNTGLFKQLQDKYNLSSPEEFFQKTTFLKNPMYFYEFTKLFDLSKVNATISHKFMNFLTSKNMVKFIFTQNIDGLEKKAKIPDDKLVFAHGNFYTGHCAQCNCSIDIEKINEGVQKGEVYYCPSCKGPCKPNVVFYGEGLPVKFFESLQQLPEVDLIIIMGTSLKVNPFAMIPYLPEIHAYKLVLNMEEVGEFGYCFLQSDALFIQGKTDSSVIKFLKDVNLYDEFSDFIKKEYNEDLNDLIGKESELMNVNDNKQNDSDKVEKLTKDLNNLDIK